jgi:hypothetical protein
MGSETGSRRLMYMAGSRDGMGKCAEDEWSGYRFVGNV